MDWIRKKYPRYVFRTDKSGNKKHWIYVVAAEKVR